MLFFSFCKPRLNGRSRDGYGENYMSGGQWVKGVGYGVWERVNGVYDGEYIGRRSEWRGERETRVKMEK